MKRFYALYFLIIIFLLLFISCHSDKYVQQELIPEEFRASQESWFYNRPYYHILSKNLSIDSLPTRIPQPKENQLTLYADFSKVWNEYILLYLINTTDDSVVLRNQDDDIYIKLEAEDKETGKWRRAQRHVYSTCGNSYGTTVLQSKNFLIYRGFYPENLKGQIAPIRYKIYYNNVENVISNIGFASINSEMIKQAKFDLMSIDTGDSAFVTQVALGKIIQPAELNYSPSRNYFRFRAIKELARFPSDSTVKYLQQIVEDNKLADYYRSAAIDVLSGLRNEKGKGVLLWLLSDTTISASLYKEAFDGLNTVSKITAMEFVRPICTNENFPYRYVVLQVLSNAFRIENEGERIESLRKKSWLYDSIKFKQEYKSTLEKETIRYRKFHPSEYKFYLLDTALFQSISSKKHDLSDPSIKDLMTCYAAYKTDDLVEYLKSIYRIPNLPDTLKEHIQWLYEDRNKDNLPSLYYNILKTDFLQKELVLIPLRWTFTNYMDGPLIFPLNTLTSGIKINIKIFKYSSVDITQSEIIYDLPDVELLMQKDIEQNLPNNIVNLQPGQKCEFTFLFNAEKYIHEFRDNQKKRFGLRLVGEWLCPHYNDIPMRIREYSTTINIY